MNTVTAQPATEMIADYTRHLRDLGRTAKTIECYTEVLNRLENELPCGLASATTDELRDWIFVDGRGQATRAHYVTIAQGFGKWAVDPADPRVDFDAAALLPKVKAPAGKAKPISDDQLRDILDRGRTPYLLWYVLAAYAGLRCMEIAGLRREHLTDREIWVHGKGGKKRSVPTHERVWELVAGLPRGPLCVDRKTGVQLNADQLSWRGNDSLRRLGYPDVHMHRLRHRFASRAFDATRDLLVVQELLGHTSVGTTQRYVEVNQERKAAAVAGIR